MSARWMLYSHDALGLGHVRRLLAIARAVLSRRKDLAALLATCSPQIDALPIPDGLDYVKLPSARKIDNYSYVSRTLRLDAERFHSLRSGILSSLVNRFEHELLLVDKSPTGLMGEMEPALESLRARGNGHRTVLGWRDILDAPDRVREEWRARDTLALIERLHDEIWVYGDPAVFDVRESYAIPDRVAERIRYLGYLSPPRDPSRRESFRGGLNLDGAPLAIVTAGGGEDGERLLQCYREAASRGLLPDGMRSLLVTGPFMSPEVVQSLAADTPPGVTVTTFLPGLDAAIAAADVVVGLAGYNTVCEVLGAGTPAVLVPRRGHREEQRIRAERLSALHVVEHLPLEGLAPNALADAVARALERGPLPAPTLPLDGLAMVRGAIERLLPSASGADAAESSRPLAAAAGSLGETIP